MNSNKAQLKTDEDRAAREAVPVVSAIENKKRSAPTVRRSPRFQEEGERGVIEEDAAVKTGPSNKKKKSDNVAVDADDGQRKDETEGQRSAVVVPSSSSSSLVSFDQQQTNTAARSFSSSSTRQRSSVDVASSSSPSSRNVTTVIVSLSTNLPIHSVHLANHSDNNVDEGGFSNMEAIVAKLRDSAGKDPKKKGRKRPYLYHFNLRSPTTSKIIMRLAPQSAKSRAEFKKLNSSSSHLGSGALYQRLRLGKSFDGLVIEKVDQILFEEDIGFLSNEAELEGRQLVSAHKAMIEGLSHCTGIRLLRPGMDVSERIAILGNATGDRFLSRLTQTDCNQLNAMIGPIMQLPKNNRRSSLSGSDVFRTVSGLSVDLYDLAVALVQSRTINELRIYLMAGRRRELNESKVAVTRSKSSFRDQKLKDITLLRDDPEQGSELVMVPAETKKIVSKELIKLNFIFRVCVSVVSLEEQQKCYVNMCEYIHDQCMHTNLLLITNRYTILLLLYCRQFGTQDGCCFLD